MPRLRRLLSDLHVDTGGPNQLECFLGVCGVAEHKIVTRLSKPHRRGTPDACRASGNDGNLVCSWHVRFSLGLIDQQDSVIDFTLPREGRRRGTSLRETKNCD